MCKNIDQLGKHNQVCMDKANTMDKVHTVTHGSKYSRLSLHVYGSRPRIWQACMHMDHRINMHESSITEQGNAHMWIMRSVTDNMMAAL